MKKLIMLFVAAFAISATSFAQVIEEAPAPAPVKRTKPVKKQSIEIPKDMNTPSRPEVRTGKIVDRINARLIEKDASLALTPDQRKELVKIHMERQMTQTSRPKLETEEDKIAFRESRKKASKLFKEQIRGVMTPEQYTVFSNVKSNRKARKGKAKAKGTLGEPKPATGNKSQKF